MQLRTALALAASLLLGGTSTFGQTIAPAYSASYSATSLGSVAGVPTNYGGINFLPGDNNTLLLGGSANNGSSAIYSVPLTRDPTSHQITSFGTPTLFSTAPGIDGGLIIAPNNDLLFTGYSGNTIGEIKPGSTSPDKTLTLDSTSIGHSVGTLQIVPAGFAGAGHLKVVSYNGGDWHDTSLVPDGSGTYDLGPIGAPIQLVNGPEGIVYIKNTNPLFPHDSVLVSEYLSGTVEAYDIDSNGDPITSTARDFITGLSGAEGAVIDPVTGDFLFSTFGSANQIVRVQGFLAPEPGAIGLIVLALLPLRRSRKM